MTARIDGIPGVVTITYTLDGNFFPGAWAGGYTFVAFVQDLGVTCTYTTSFDGDQVSSRSAAFRFNESALSDDDGLGALAKGAAMAGGS